LEEESPKGTLTTQVYLRLRFDVLSGTLEPGRKLRIEELARTYGSGSSPVREALHLLASEGLVERLEQRGFRVRPINEAEFLDILQMRCWTEERALRESIALGDSSWEEAIVLNFYRLEQIDRGATQQERNGDWEKQHKSFHAALISAASSPMLKRYCDQLFDLTIRYRVIARPRSGKRRHVQAEHRAIMEATLRRDPEEASRCLLAHYRLTGDYLRKGLFPRPVAAGQIASGQRARRRSTPALSNG
jgi:DNA-binding GntR family transcriptional regulator